MPSAKRKPIYLNQNVINVTLALTEIAAGLTCIITLGYVYPGWPMSYLVWKTGREAALKGYKFP
jgi:hypothetical protein